MKRTALAFTFTALALAGCGGSGKIHGPTTPEPEATPIGAMLDQTGSQIDFTPEYTAACQLAVEDENARLASANSAQRFALHIRDSASTPNGAATALNGFASDGISYVIGPRTSTQCTALLANANAKDIAVLSTRSVADDLAKPDDALFRLLAPDNEVVPQVAKAALSRGLQYMCVLYRDDVYGISATAELKAQMQSAGGDVVYSQSYSAATGPTDAELQHFAEQVIAMHALHGAHTGVAYFSLSEMVPGFAKLNAQPDTFRTVGAVAAQSLANVPAMLTNADTRAYCDASGFQAVSFALTNKPAIETSAGSALLGRISARSGRTTPDELSINVYDGMRALMYAAERTGTSHIGNMNVEVASAPAGTFGTMHFDANGDRIGDFYGVYQIDDSGTPKWVRSATLTP